MPALELVRFRCCPTCRASYRSDFPRCPTDGALLEEHDRDPLLGAAVAEHYEIDELIGEGGMGRVYRAHHTRLQHRQFAIKVLIGDLATTAEMRMRFAQEAEAASRLDHPNVVSVVDFGRTTEGLMFLAMELVAGPTLADVIAACGPIAPSRVISIARQLCLGLAHAHDRGFVHRDFKPDNVIVALSDGREVPRIVDFGLAISSDELATRLTTAGVALGTPIYAAPEQTHGEPVDRRADLFALGVTLYEMLAGTTPFEGGALEVMHQNATARPPSIAGRGGTEVPAALEAIVRKLMARAPEDRFASAMEVVEALDRVAAVAQVEVVEPRRRLRWGVGVAVGAIAGLVAVAISMTTDVLPETAVTTVSPPPPLPTSPPPPQESPPPPASPPRTDPPPASPAVAVATRPSRRRVRTVPVIPAPVVEAVRTVPALPPPVVEAVVEPVVAPAVVEPVAAVEPPPIVALPPATPRSLVDARATIGSLQIRGSLSTALVRRAIERTGPELRRCYLTVARATGLDRPTSVRVAFEIDDTRRATKIRAEGAPELSRCIIGVLGGVRTQIAPDVGAVPVSLEVAFAPELR